MPPDGWVEPLGRERLGEVAGPVVPTVIEFGHQWSSRGRTASIEGPGMFEEDPRRFPVAGRLPGEAATVGEIRAEESMGSPASEDSARVSSS